MKQINKNPYLHGADILAEGAVGRRKTINKEVKYKMFQMVKCAINIEKGMENLGWGGRGIVILNRVAKEGSTYKISVERKFEEANYMGIRGDNIPAGGNSKCQKSEASGYRECWRIGKEVSVAGAGYGRRGMEV